MLELKQYQFLDEPLHSPKPKSKGVTVLREIGKFLLLFSLFFVITTLIVMGPTLYTRFSYLLTMGGKTTVEKQTGLPSVTYDNSKEVDLPANRVTPKGNWLIIPSINVSAPIIYPTSSDNTAILEAIKSGVAHFPGSVKPGQIGNSFLTGHSSYYWWSGGKYNQVFANLSKLKVGDLVYYYYQGGEFIYKITGSKVVSPDEVKVLNSTDTPTITLMTCTPIGTNLRRLIVTGDLISSPSSLVDYQAVESLGSLPKVIVR